MCAEHLTLLLQHLVIYTVDCTQPLEYVTTTVPCRHEREEDGGPHYFQDKKDDTTMAVMMTS